MTHPLAIVGYINPLVADALRDPTSGINTMQLRAEPNAGISGAVVMKADADAVIARLHDALTVKDDLHMDAALKAFHRMRGYSDLEKVRAAVTAYCEALKGPEA